VLGRNWTVYQNRRRLPTSALKLADNALRAIPSLCNELYLIGTK
jgi:hypothetical protein